MPGKLKVKLVRGLAGKRRDHRLTVRALGLRRPGNERILPDTPEVWGQIEKVRYLLRVERMEEA